MKKIEYYQKKFLERMTSFWGFMTILSSVFCGGFISGMYVKEHLHVLEDIKREREYSIELIDCENERMKEVSDIREKYMNEILELKQSINENKHK